MTGRKETFSLLPQWYGRANHGDSITYFLFLFLFVAFLLQIFHPISCVQRACSSFESLQPFSSCSSHLTDGWEYYTYTLTTHTRTMENRMRYVRGDRNKSLTEWEITVLW